VTLDDWIHGHAFLRPLARLHARVGEAITAAAPACPPLPDWDAYDADFASGVPLLASPATAIDTTAIDRAIERVMAAVQDGDPPVDEGFVHAIGWLTRAAALAPLRQAFDLWRDEDQWLRPHCPTCGSQPAMAQLAGVDPGRQRLLSCGCCRTRWRFRRTTCPFCETQSHRLASLGIEGEGGLRIDYCESCRGYLKTYSGQGDESVLLADWTSLHLDLAAGARGWRRTAASLYRLPSDPDSTPAYRSGSEMAEGSVQAARADR
jgi:FdhE protein